MHYLYASTNIGCEKLLESELISLGAKNLNIIKGGVYYEAEDLLIYQSLIWSRIASRIFLCIKKFIIQNSHDLYIHTYEINWDKILYLNKTFLVKCKGNNNIIKNSLFGALIIQDAIVDQFYKRYYIRPNVNTITPDIIIDAILQYNTIDIMLDLSGHALNQRGYRVSSDIELIKANLSAAIILSSAWQKNMPLIDPMCGSGTFLIEAAMIYSKRAPGLKRKKWNFQSWRGYDQFLWNIVLKEAHKKFEDNIHRCKKNLFIGYDCNNSILEQARENAFNADVLDIIKFSILNLNNLNNPYPEKVVGTLLITPPYQEKANTESTLVGLYVHMGYIFKKYFKNWKLSIFTSSKSLLNFLYMQAYEKFFFNNTTVHFLLKNYKIFSTQKNQQNSDYKNRLKKNIQKLKKWRNFQNIECLRIYDRDIPNYNIIVDIYKKWLVIHEYQAPKTINTHDAYKRLCHAIYHTKEILSISIDNIVFKTRKKQKNKSQYQKFFNSKKFFIIQEYDAKLLINLVDYLDTGLFLEHRGVRKLINKMSYGKDFLNLFAYTGTASVAAGLGGAQTTTTVDISNTYIQWSIENMSINSLTGNKHFFIQANCLEWITLNHQTFDLIFINPPTFSNSKKMKKDFELKKDYLHLINSLKKNLRKNGYIIFSSSTKNFIINVDAINKMQLCIKNITHLVESKDFLNKKYYSWLIKHI